MERCNRGYAMPRRARLRSLVSPASWLAASPLLSPTDGQAVGGGVVTVSPASSRLSIRGAVRGTARRLSFFLIRLSNELLCYSVRQVAFVSLGG
ncbi:hypothetical protein N658DRAFT_492839 [Parathielavia hyrcaniae]|uniref:Uncharacterized protein n=1 Tax=Parathielavia hyrcaniae TaxID=113614 RepID=A0AAN6T5F1_9PEZI|nr:hypothetical protein N658DRAFT_492839 [Parathielavia hyrcaniae]